MKPRNERLARAVADFWGKSLGPEDREWYSISAVDGAGAAEIRIYDVIGWPFIDANTFVGELNALQASDITVRINSPGGDVFDGTAIYNALAAHPAKVTTRIEGLAASMASVIAMAGDTVEIAKNAYLMIHNPWTFAMGDHVSLAQEADLLQRIAATLAQVYADKTGLKPEDVQALMDAETWYIGQEAVDAGLSDRLTNQGSASARFDLSIFNHAPETPAEPTKRDLERVLTQDAGLSRSMARALLQSGFDAITTRDAGGCDLSEAKLFIQSMGDSK